jgi:hypothetical protein
MYLNKLKQNYQIILVVVTIIFLYVLFYTDYIVNNNAPLATQVTQHYVQHDMQMMPMMQMNHPENVHVNNSPYMIFPSSSPSQTEKHVRFDNQQNKEIVYEIGQPNNLEAYQRIAKCEYPTLTDNHMNRTDCIANQTCLTRFTPQEWFKMQRSVNSDLPGFNGSTLSTFQNTEPEGPGVKMMRDKLYCDNKVYEENGHYYVETPKSEAFNNILYQNAPFTGDTSRGAMPFDLCRSCTVGTCQNDACGQSINSLNYN